jgi:hypothetical protein
MRIAEHSDRLWSSRGRLARCGVGILPVLRRERDAPETAGKMPALHP